MIIYHHYDHSIDNENSITFKYVAMSDGKEKKAIFYKNSGGIVGISIY